MHPRCSWQVSRGSGWAFPTQLSSGGSPKVHPAPARCTARRLPHGGGQSLTSLPSWVHQAARRHPLPVPGHHPARRTPAVCPASWTFCSWTRPLGGGRPPHGHAHSPDWCRFSHSTAPRKASLEPSGQHTLARPLRTGPPRLPKPAPVPGGPGGLPAAPSGSKRPLRPRAVVTAPLPWGCLQRRCLSCRRDRLEDSAFKPPLSLPCISFNFPA